MSTEGRARGGAVVVLRARESCVHGEGRQCVTQRGWVMSEATAVKTGVPISWPDPETAAFRVRRMQTKLHYWAKDDPSCRFEDLFNLVYDPAFLVHAWERVSSNKGARTAGVDKVTVAQIGAYLGAEAFLNHIRGEVKSHSFRPSPVRQVKIPKGGGKTRTLGIPTVTDRVVQAALKLVLEPVFEADFVPFSYGFRPGRSTHDAIAEIHHLASEPSNYTWVLEADIAACFDTIDHSFLMGRVRRRIKDKHVCDLVKAFLKAGVMTTHGERDSVTGTPQGGILSPLLANIALSALDDHFAKQWEPRVWKRHTRKKIGLGNWRLIRYADDFVIMVSGEKHRAEALRAEVEQVLAPIGLTLSPEKTRTVHIDEGFDFLGVHIHRKRKPGTAKHYVYTTPSKKAIQAIKDEIRHVTDRSTRNLPVDKIITTVDRKVRGWANHFRHEVAASVFSKLDHYTWWRLIRWIRAKHRRTGMPAIISRFTRDWRITHQGATYRGTTTVVITRHRYRGTNIPAPWRLTTIQ
jgi:RNA-directed DNA polymerase